MANYPGYLDPAIGPNAATSRAYWHDWDTLPQTAPEVWRDERAGFVPSLEVRVGTTTGCGAQSPVGGANFDGTGPACGPGGDWFDKIILLPRRIDAGPILSTQIYTIQLYSSYRTAREWLSYWSTCGAGVSITDLPVVPRSTPPQSGYTMHLQIVVDGPPSIDGDLNFEYDTITVLLPVTGQRTVLLPFQPEAPVVEHLEFLTDVRARRNGTEQRASLRSAPRQVFEVPYLLNGSDRKRLTLLLHKFQALPLGFPLWTESTVLTAATTIGNPTISVESTAYADYREDGLAVIFKDSENLEVLQVDSFGAGSITFQSNVTKSFPAGTMVMPVRVTYASEVLRGERYQAEMQLQRVRLVVVDNNVSLASTAGFSTFNSKVLLDDPNAVDTMLQETLERRLEILDSETGVFAESSAWSMSRRGHAKRFFTRTRQRLWQVRCLLHALRGRAVSFYIPTFFPDLVPLSGIGAGSSVITVSNIGYTRYINAAPPLNTLRVKLTDGSTIVRGIASAVEIDEAQEEITVNAPWGVDALLGAISSVEFVEKVRMDDDDVVLTHQDGAGQADIEMKVKAVLD